MARIRKLHIGNDAALQRKGIEVLEAFMKRDLRALNPAKTTALSNRELILDDPTVPDNVPSNKPLWDAADMILTRLRDNLAETITV